MDNEVDQEIAIPEPKPAGAVPIGGTALSPWNRISSELFKTVFYARYHAMAVGVTKVDAGYLFTGMLIVDSETSNGLQLPGELGVDVPELREELAAATAKRVQAQWPPAPKALPNWARRAFVSWL